MLNNIVNNIDVLSTVGHGAALANSITSALEMNRTSAVFMAIWYAACTKTAIIELEMHNKQLNHSLPEISDAERKAMGKDNRTALAVLAHTCAATGTILAWRGNRMTATLLVTGGALAMCKSISTAMQHDYLYKYMQKEQVNVARRMMGATA